MRSDVPEGWELIPIGNLISESRIKGSNGADANKLTVKLYGKGVVSKKERNIGSENTIYFRRRSGQFIYSKLDFLNGAFAIIPDDLDGRETTADLPAFDFSDSVCPKWFLEFVSRTEFYERHGGAAIGSRKARRVSPTEFGRTEIPLPPLAEQRKIAAILTSVDEAIQATEAVIAQTRRVKEGLLQELLTKGIGHTRFKQTEIGEIPETWEVKRLGECGKWLSGGTPSRQKPEYWGGSLPWISAKSIHEFYIESSQECLTELGAQNGTRVVPKGSILFVVRGMSLAKDFRIGIAMRDVAFNQDLKAILVDQSQFDPLFLGYYLVGAKSTALQMVSNASHGTCKLDTAKLEGLPVRIPPLIEQRRIATMVAALDSTIYNGEEQKGSIHQLKSGLLQDLLTGRVRVKGG